MTTSSYNSLSHISFSFVLSASWSPDGNSIVTASFDGTARVWHRRSLIDLENNRNMLKQALFILLVERLHRTEEPLDLNRVESLHLMEIFDSLEEFAQKYLIENCGVVIPSTWMRNLKRNLKLNMDNHWRIGARCVAALVERINVTQVVTFNFSK